MNIIANIITWYGIIIVGAIWKTDEWIIEIKQSAVSDYRYKGSFIPMYIL